MNYFEIPKSDIETPREKMLLEKKRYQETCLIQGCLIPSILKKCIICESQGSKAQQNEVCRYWFHGNSGRGERSERTFKATMAENFPNLGKEMDIQIFEAQQIPSM